MEALLSFLLRVPADMRDWVEKCFIQAVAMAFASKLRDQARIDFIKRTTQSMDARRFSSLGRQASHAALIVRYIYLGMLSALLIIYNSLSGHRSTMLVAKISLTLRRNGAILC